jgi:hypothetical protein
VCWDVASKTKPILCDGGVVDEIHERAVGSATPSGVVTIVDCAAPCPDRLRTLAMRPYDDCMAQATESGL